MKRGPHIRDGKPSKRKDSPASSMDIHRDLTISLYDDGEPSWSGWTDNPKEAIRDVRKRYLLSKATAEYTRRWLEAMGVLGSSVLEREQGLNDQEADQAASDSQPPP